MNPYSHIVIASKLETYVNPKNRKEYYWGAIAPDVRYPAGMLRKETHISGQQIVGFFYNYPHLKSFLQGYMVHCLSDEVDLERIFSQHFPFCLIKRELSRRQIAFIFELFYFENEKVYKIFSETYNEVLSDLGIDETISSHFSRIISRYARTESLSSRMSELFHLLGTGNDNTRIDKYMTATQNFQKNWLLKNIVFSGIRSGKISEQITACVISAYQQLEWEKISS